MNLLLLMEAALVAVSLKFAKRSSPPEKALRRLAGHRAAPLAVGLLAMILRLAVLPIEPIPTPTIHDEFSYLLAADTFAHGRLANPTHPLWRHFETMQEEFQPTYASMYPPLQGLVLAAGLVFTGVAFAGMWVAVGVMCAAICWALRGWFPPGWALLGGALAAIRLGIFTYWANSYWGGALAAIGGALLIGALPRFLRSGRARYAAVGAAGAVILVNTRPYEGLVLSLAVGLIALISGPRRRLTKAVLAAMAIVVPAGALMAYYNWRVFGSPATLPYSVNRRTYAVAQVFLFQKPAPAPHYLHQALHDYYINWELPYFLSARTPGGYVRMMTSKVVKSLQFFIGPVLTLPLLAAFWTWRSRRTRTFLFLLAAMGAAMALVPWYAPHYAAPATVLIWGLLIQGMRALRLRWPGIVRAIPVICVVMLVARVAMGFSHIPFVLTYPMTWATTGSEPIHRAEVTRQLHSYGGRHLVIVHYRPDHDPLLEYVFNDADIDASEIVWARDMGEEGNEDLLRYYRDRKVWVLEADRDPPELRSYSR
jgi:hypothetical protein